MPRTLLITGGDLDIRRIWAFVADPKMSAVIDDDVFARTQESRMMLEKNLTSKVIYGVNTGFGPMASHLISRKALTELQTNLIRSHAVGMGAPVPDPLVLAAMLVRLNTLARGMSGVSAELLHALAAVINHRIIPEVPEHGAVGTSGDLVQLAHVGLALIGEGHVRYRDERMPAARALKLAGLEPYRLIPRDGLAVINGTSFMAGIMAVACRDADRLLSVAVRSGAWALELIGAFADGLSERLHELRPHRGQLTVGLALRELTAGSRLIKQREAFQRKHRITEATRFIDEDVQEIYSFRCIPQIVGPSLDVLARSRETVETEINSVTDNPIVDPVSGKFLHGGNFHGEYVAQAADELRAAMAKLTLLAERQINFFLNRNVNRRLPPFLNLATAGLNLSLQGLQFVATSTASHAQSMAYPHRVHSMSTNADNQDVVSMGTDSALLTMKTAEDLRILCAVELITLAQATDVMRATRRLSPAASELYRAVRRVFPAVTKDRVLVDELPAVTDLIRAGAGLDVAWRTPRISPLFSG
ncbi:MAG TPA: aromatic amino acid ammonia-lyase [Candidatus Paceibacterota bacterium]|nr:aromatic amino acid ammonia-lyase [Candidatus Paceibacterota bacterium]